MIGRPNKQTEITTLYIDKEASYRGLVNIIYHYLPQSWRSKKKIVSEFENLFGHHLIKRVNYSLI